MGECLFPYLLVGPNLNFQWYCGWTYNFSPIFLYLWLWPNMNILRISYVGLIQETWDGHIFWPMETLFLPCCQPLISHFTSLICPPISAIQNSQVLPAGRKSFCFHFSSLLAFLSFMCIVFYSKGYWSSPPLPKLSIHLHSLSLLLPLPHSGLTGAAILAVLDWWLGEKFWRSSSWQAAKTLPGEWWTLNRLELPMHVSSWREPTGSLKNSIFDDCLSLILTCMLTATHSLWKSDGVLYVLCLEYSFLTCI